ncbi:MAG: hypothetical protein GY698_12155 [Actinomycetia bacterium]|nr:hypothetical protein [Actinomycetes bacterium]
MGGLPVSLRAIVGVGMEYAVRAVISPLTWDWRLATSDQPPTDDLPATSGRVFPRRWAGRAHVGVVGYLVGARARLYGAADSGPESRVAVLASEPQAGGTIYRGSIVAPPVALAPAD